MLPLRFPLLWLLLGWALVVGVAGGSLLPGAVILGLPISDKLAHAGSYALLMVWFAGLYARKRYVMLALTLIALGIVLELAQARLHYRSFDPMDLVANVIGILLGLGLSLSLLAGWCQWVERRLGYHD